MLGHAVAVCWNLDAQPSFFEGVVLLSMDVNDFIIVLLSFSDGVNLNFLAALVIGTLPSGAQHDLPPHFFFVIGEVGP